MLGQKGPFLGFTFNNIHSSIIGITRTCSGRYEDTLIPQLKDLAIDKVSTDGQFFYGSTYSKREFTIHFAFDGMTESQLQLMKEKWMDKEIHQLIFDEYPYKVYSAKITGKAILKHLAFDEGADRTIRVYRGEGSFIFTCYFPYAQSLFEYQEDYGLSTSIIFSNRKAKQTRSDLTAMLIFELEGEVTKPESYVITDDLTLDWVPSGTRVIDVNKTMEYCGFIVVDEADEPDEPDVPDTPEWLEDDGWLSASKIPSNTTYGDFNSGAYHLYNAGDVEVPFQIWFDAKSLDSFSISCGDKSISIININKYKKFTEDKYIVFDSGTQAIQGYNANQRPTGSLYNYAISSGDFFLLPTGEQFLKVTGAIPTKLNFHYWYL